MSMRNLIIAFAFLLAAPVQAATPLDTAYANVAAASAVAARAASVVAADEAAVATATAAVQQAQVNVFPAQNLGAVVTGNAALVSAISALGAAQGKLGADAAALSTAQATLQTQMTALNMAVTAADACGATPCPQLPESANLASVPPLAALVDAVGGTWTLTPGGQVAQNGVADTRTGKVTTLAYVNHAVWQNAFGLWWSWSGTAWLPAGGTTADPRVTPAPPPSGGRNFLLGVYMDPPDSPTFSSFMGYAPDFTIDYSYMGPSGNGSNPCNAANNNGNGGYPTVIGIGSYDGEAGLNDPTKAGDGSYNSVYAQTMTNFANACASTLYAARINWEWPGFWFQSSPSYDWSGSGKPLPQANWVPPSVWIAGFRNLVNAFRANPATAHIKISWDFPMQQYGGAAALAYYPGDAYVDIISADYYFSPQYDGTSANSWAKAIAPGGLNDMAAFAVAHGKPMAFWEWADMFTDGYVTQQFRAWMQSQNVIALSVWDSNDALSSPAALNQNATRKSAFVAAFGASKYTGTYWKQIALPATLLPGF